MPATRSSPMPPPCARWASPPRSRPASSPNTCWAIPNANAFVGGCALTTDFIKSRPDVARRFTAAWEKAVRLINENPNEARKHLVKNTFTPDDVVETVPMIRYFMAKDLTPRTRRTIRSSSTSRCKTVRYEKVDVTNICRRSDRRSSVGRENAVCARMRAACRGEAAARRRHPPTSPSAA